MNFKPKTKYSFWLEPDTDEDDNNSCCICYDTDEGLLECHFCKEGFVCLGCVCHLGDIVGQPIKCPICNGPFVSETITEILFYAVYKGYGIHKNNKVVNSWIKTIGENTKNALLEGRWVQKLEDAFEGRPSKIIVNWALR